MREARNLHPSHFGQNKRSQDIKGKYLPTGNLYIYRSYLYKNKLQLPKKTYGLISNGEKWVDIDYQKDLWALNFYLKKLKNRRILITT